VNRSYIDGKIDDDPHSNELQCYGLDPLKPHLQEDDIR
jgi:hypothetical protein